MPIKSNGFKGNKQLSPKNYGMANVAQTRLNAYVARANAQLEEAIFVDGIPCLHWSKSENLTRKCTCSFKQNEIEDPFIDEEDEIYVEGVADLGSKNVDDLLGGRVVFRSDIPRESDLEADESDLDGGKSDIFSRPQNFALNKADLLEAQNDLNAINSGNFISNFIAGFEASKCGICFGAGSVNAYRPTGFQRILLESTHDDLKLKGFELNQHEYPHTFEAEGQEKIYVEWQVELPAYFKAPTLFRIMNNDVEVKPFLALIKVPGEVNGFTPISLPLLQSLKGKASKAIIRVIPNPTLIEPGARVKFTHVEILYQLADLPYMQAPALSESIDLRYGTRLVTSELTLSPKLLNVRREDLIYDAKNGALWKVTSVTDGKTSKGQIFSWQASVSNILLGDSLYAMKGNCEVILPAPYSGLEQIQGNAARSLKMKKKVYPK